MSRSDLVFRLAEAGAKGDRDALQRTMDLLATEAIEQGRHSQARRLSGLTIGGKPRRAEAPKPDPGPTRGLPDTVRDLLVDRVPRRTLDEMILSPSVTADVREFLQEQEEVALLRANSLEPRHAVLLVGPPGNGKTTLAEAIATELGLPFLTVRYDGVVDSYLGETAMRIRRIIDHAAAAPCVLFFDEFDAIGKERGDVHETGEIKRVVNSLLLQLDSLPTHSVVVCATNHPELLDRAVERRFQLRIELPRPGPDEIVRMYRRLAGAPGGAGLTQAQYVAYMSGRSTSEIEQFNLDVRRRLVLSRGAMSAGEAARSVLDRWSRQYGFPAENEKEDAGKADRSDQTRTKSRKSHQRKKRALPAQAVLPGTG
ncbi:ATP-binding protein [Methylobacterium fujisawaense]|uniref:ATP-binding protein n=1 Tax=Methylobacterium fujisawaense TaxID=107400 RepID=UPI00313B66F0